MSVAGMSSNVAYPSIVTMLSDRVAASTQSCLMGCWGRPKRWAGISAAASGALGGLKHALPVLLGAALIAGAALAMTVAGAASTAIRVDRGDRVDNGVRIIQGDKRFRPGDLDHPGVRE